MIQAVLNMLKGLKLGGGQLPDTHDRIRRATKDISIAEINAHTVWTRRVSEGDR